MKKKEWTPHQLTRLPKAGYWLSLFDGGNGYMSTHLYCVMNGRVKYIREDTINGDLMSAMPSWFTLQWNCMPTQKMIDNSKPEENYHYFATHKEVMEAHPNLPETFKTQAPND